MQAHTHTQVWLYWGLFLFLTAIHASLAGFVQANWQMAHWVFPFTAAGGEEEEGRHKWLKRKEKCWKVWERERERDQTTYYSDVHLLTVRQTGELCHTGWTNRRQRNWATYDVSAGMGWELPAWGSFPMSRQTVWAYSDTLIISNTKTQPTCFLLYNPCLALFALELLIFIFHSHSCLCTEHRGTKLELTSTDGDACKTLDAVCI